VFGPGRDGARLEGSKAWMKDVLTAAGVPTARYHAFTEAEEHRAVEFLKSLPPPWVIKTDGLAAGKGVLVTYDLAEAVDDVQQKLRGATFGAAGTTVVVEEGLTGPELSVLAICDGTRAVALPAAQDFKRVGTGDTGPNTGGMGAYSPVPGADEQEVMDRAVMPTLDALRARGIDYRGVLYAGLMLTPDGVRVIEYNVRFGDPEAEVVLPRIDDDLVAWLTAAADGELPKNEAPKRRAEACVTVMMAAAGYPQDPRKGDVITGIDEANKVEGVRVYHAGTTTHHAGTATKDLTTSGGRVLAVTALGRDHDQARSRAYEGVAKIHFDGAHWRTDIGPRP
jgi:phosphoribosylamine--glycine ligase